jgi:O2-independent ubiquinone biosynthesis accessory factor UbiT
MFRSFASSSDSPPLIPAFLGNFIRPLPLLPLEFALAGVLDRIGKNHPHLLDRLGQHKGKRFGIEPIDLPFAFVVEASAPRPRLTVMRELRGRVDVRISSSLANLLALVEGRLDGDALLFSRQLAIEGDVEALLALRNAIDDARLDLAAEIGSLFGPFGELVERLFGTARDIVLRSTLSPPGK